MRTLIWGFHRGEKLADNDFEPMPWSARLRADWRGSCPPLGEVIYVARTVPKGVCG